jgi:hypothetical protein
VKAFNEAPQRVKSRGLRGGAAPMASLPSGQMPSWPVLPTPNSRGELPTQLAVACLGAGVITTLAVAQGQNPLTALGITLFSAVAAVAVGQVL